LKNKAESSHWLTHKLLAIILQTSVKRLTPPDKPALVLKDNSRSHSLTPEADEQAIIVSSVNYSDHLPILNRPNTTAPPKTTKYYKATISDSASEQWHVRQQNEDNTSNINMLQENTRQKQLEIATYKKT